VGRAGLDHAPGKEPLPHPVTVQTRKVGHALGEACGVVGQTFFAVEQVLQDVVAGIAQIRLRIDDQPRLALGSEHVAGMQVSAQKHYSLGSLGEGAKQLRTRPRQAWVDRAGFGRHGGAPLRKLGHPCLTHLPQWAEHKARPGCLPHSLE